MSQTQIPFLDLQSPNRALSSEFQAFFADAVNKAAFIGGPAVQNFEAAFAKYVGTVGCTALNSGTDALRFAIMGMGLKSGDRVVTVSNSFIATTEAISQAGCKIDFVDVDEKTALMDPQKLRAYLEAAEKRNALPKLIIPVHLYGQCCDMDPINELAKKYGIKVLEDACQAHGSTYKGRAAGTLGDAAAFSFYPGKNLGALGDAGAIVSNDLQLIEYAKVIRDHGQRQKYVHEYEGYNGRMDAIQAGFLSIKLKHLDEWNKKRVTNAKFYDKLLKNVPQVRPTSLRDDGTSCYHLYVIHTPKRDALHAFLKDRGVNTAFHYPVPLHLQSCYKNLGFKKGDFPIAEKLCSELISLPMFPELTEQQIQYTVESLQAFFKEQ